MRHLIIIFILAGNFSNVMSEEATTQVWQFKVSIGDKHIGHHRYELKREENDEIKVYSNAQFDYKFLGINLYKYRHVNQELWRNGCLIEIDSKTDDNGKQFFVSGKATNKGFTLQNNDGVSTLPSCISSFAYWDRSLLEKNHLLNSQNGSFMPVKINNRGNSKVDSSQFPSNADLIEIETEASNIQLWYEDKSWLALESLTESGKILRYVLETVQ